MLMEQLGGCGTARADNNREKLDADDDVLDFKVQEILDEVQNHKYSMERELERLRDKEVSGKQALVDEEARLEQIKARLLESQASTQSLLEVESKYKNMKAEMAGALPELTTVKNLYYHISGVTLDKTTKNNHVKGFIVNARKDDVKTFSFNMDKPDVSRELVINYLWDTIGAGANTVWNQL